MIRKLLWALSNRVVASEITVNEAGYFRSGEFLTIGRELRRVHSVDFARLVLRVY